jgi:HK97 family phage portal protein
MGVLNRIGSSIRSALGGAVRGYGVPTNDYGGGGGGWLAGWTNSPHEPFAGAWQQNLEKINTAGPNLYANSGIYACVSVISSDVACLQPRVLRRRTDGSREEHQNHPAWALLQKPNTYQTSLQFVQRYLMSKLTSGNAYVLLFRDARGVVNEMYVLNPNTVQPLITDNGDVYYRIARAPLHGVATTDSHFVVPARDVIHDRMNPIWHDLIGISPMFAAGMSAMTSARIQMSSERFFANMARAGGVLVTPNKMDPTLAKKLQTEWEKNYSQGGLGKTAILTNGLSFEPMTVNAVDAEVVNQLRWGIEDIARVYRVPTFMVGELSKATFKNNEQMARTYYDGCLKYHISSFEQAFTYGLELGTGIEVEMDLSALLRLDAETRFTAHQSALQAGIKSINEVRHEEDLPPVAGGEQPRIQMQYVSLSLADKLAEATAAAGAGPTPAPKPPAPEPAPAPKAIDAYGQLELDLLADAFEENFQLGEANGA